MHIELIDSIQICLVFCFYLSSVNPSRRRKPQPPAVVGPPLQPPPWRTAGGTRQETTLARAKARTSSHQGSSHIMGGQGGNIRHGQDARVQVLTGDKAARGLGLVQRCGAGGIGMVLGMKVVAAVFSAVAVPYCRVVSPVSCGQVFAVSQLAWLKPTYI